MDYQPIKTGETTREKMMEISPNAPAPQAYQPALQPMAQPSMSQPMVSSPSNYSGGPSQAVTIDSNGVSYESGYGMPDEGEPVLARPTVSRYMDY